MVPKSCRLFGQDHASISARVLAIQTSHQKKIAGETAGYRVQVYAGPQASSQTREAM
jgi:hypothetical protein